MGIDLGTTYSCVAYVNENGKPEVVVNSADERTTPSVVWFDGQRVVVGTEAKNMASVQPGEVVSFVKRYMGDSSFFFQCRNGRMRPEEISSYILKKLVKDASQTLQREIKDVVITCPAYFFIKEREATKKAGIDAGLNVLQILNEPTAAAIAYGFSHSGETSRNILVYDLGGGTFDVTMIQMGKGKVEVICTGGDHRLGGKDWDDAIVALLIQKYQEETGDFENLLEIPEAVQDLQQLAETTKKQLSLKQEAVAKFTYAGESHRLLISREAFESATENLLERTIGFTDTMLEDAKRKGIDSFDELLLVGGSSKMPQIIKRLREKYQIEPKIFDPDEAVAKGAAIVGNNAIIREALEAKVKELTGEEFSLEVEGGESSPALEQAQNELMLEGISGNAIQSAMTQITNVASKSFGSLFLDREDPKAEKLRLINLIYRNTSIPTTVEYPCSTVHDNQKSVRFEIVENSEDEPVSEEEKERGFPPEVGVILWQDDLALPVQTMPKGAPLKIVFKMDQEGLLDATCIDETSGNSIHTVIKTMSNVSKEEAHEIASRQAMLTID
ncbi:MAG: Hsp70 family protein [Victivallaceae bacterium]|nr:Hsp70 family protein [Victivallaceae bacterium]